LTAVGISGGLLPCPSALVVLLAALSLHSVALGLLLIFAFSIGLALSITGIGLVAILAKHTFRRFEVQGRLIGLLPAASALVIVLAGVAMTVALASLVSGRPVHSDVAMTGEITLRGRVLPIGGLKEKLLAALRAGITTVFIPKENEKDLAEIPDNVKKHLKLIPVADVDEVIAQALARRPVAIEWEEPPDPPVPAPAAQPAAQASLPH